MPADSSKRLEQDKLPESSGSLEEAGLGETPLAHRDVAGPEAGPASARSAFVPAPLDSGVYVASRPVASQASNDAETSYVTLVVYGWHSVQPGTLSWVFPSLNAAIQAVRVMRNAVQWAIVAGKKRRHGDLASHVGYVPGDVAEARAGGEVLLEAV